MIIILLAVAVISCKKKYEEGPRFSIWSPIQRLTGEYVLKEYIVDGIDSTDYYLTHHFNNCSEYYFDIQKNTSSGDPYGYSATYCNGDPLINDQGALVQGRWYFLADDSVRLYFSLPDPVNPTYLDTTVSTALNRVSDWHILQLKSGKMKLEAIFNQSVYVLGLKLKGG